MRARGGPPGLASLRRPDQSQPFYSWCAVTGPTSRTCAEGRARCIVLALSPTRMLWGISWRLSSPGWSPGSWGAALARGSL